MSEPSGARSTAPESTVKATITGVGQRIEVTAAGAKFAPACFVIMMVVGIVYGPSDKFVTLSQFGALGVGASGAYIVASKQSRRSWKERCAMADEVERLVKLRNDDADRVLRHRGSSDAKRGK